MQEEIDGVDTEDAVDLSELEGFSFRPAWDRPQAGLVRFERGHSEQANTKRGSFSKNFTNRERGRGGGFSRGDRKAGDGRFSSAGDVRTRAEGNRRHRGERNDSSGGRGRRDPFSPVVTVEFYPNDAVYDGVVTALKATRKTYELFNVARLFLEKPERFAMVIKKTDGQQYKNLYLSNDDNFVWSSEDDAINHCLEVHIEKYFSVHEREVGSPSGKFLCLHKCGITGKVLCPPNYHKYHELLTEHHKKFLARMPFDKFKSRIEKTSDAGEIDAWKADCAKIKIFTPKDSIESSATQELRSSTEVRQYFINHLKDAAITSFSSVRVSGETFSRMPRSLLAKSIFVLIEREKRFPLNFSNNLRGRLRRSGFTIYKMGGKSGISYISGIRRKFRTVGDVFADDVQRIVTCIDKSPKISITDLYLQYLNASRVLPSSEMPVDVAVNSSSCAEVTSDNAEKGDDGVAGTVVSYAAVADATTHADAAVDNDAVICSPSAGGMADDATSTYASRVAEQVSNTTVEDNRTFLKNLHWLIMEGYVVEFEDGKLMATEIMAVPADKTTQSPSKNTGNVSKTDDITATKDEGEGMGELTSVTETVS